MNPIDIDALYRKWERGVAPPNLTYPSLKGLYQWFLRQCELKEIDPETIDFEALVAPSLTYSENKTILAEMIEVPMTEEEEMKIHSVDLELKLEQLKKGAKRLKETDEELKRA